MAGVPHDDVAGRVEDPVHRERQLDRTEVRAEVPASGCIDGVDDELPDLRAQRVELLVREVAQIRWTGDPIELHTPVTVSEHLSGGRCAGQGHRDEVAGAERDQAADRVDPEVVGGDEDAEQRDERIGRSRALATHLRRTRESSTSIDQVDQPMCIDGMAAHWLDTSSTPSWPNESHPPSTASVSTKPNRSHPSAVRASSAAAAAASGAYTWQPPYSPGESIRRGGISEKDAKPISANSVMNARVFRHFGIDVGATAIAPDQRERRDGEVGGAVQDVPEADAAPPGEVEVPTLELGLEVEAEAILDGDDRLRVVERSHRIDDVAATGRAEAVPDERVHEVDDQDVEHFLPPTQATSAPKPRHRDRRPRAQWWVRPSGRHSTRPIDEARARHRPPPGLHFNQFQLVSVHDLLTALLARGRRATAVLTTRGVRHDHGLRRRRGGRRSASARCGPLVARSRSVDARVDLRVEVAVDGVTEAEIVTTGVVVRGGDEFDLEIVGPASFGAADRAGSAGRGPARRRPPLPARAGGGRADPRGGRALGRHGRRCLRHRGAGPDRTRRVRRARPARRPRRCVLDRRRTATRVRSARSRSMVDGSSGSSEPASNSRWPRGRCRRSR